MHDNNLIYLYRLGIQRKKTEKLYDWNSNKNLLYYFVCSFCVRWATMLWNAISWSVEQ
jgi:hypothetical protein